MSGQSGCAFQSASDTLSPQPLFQRPWEAFGNFHLSKKEMFFQLGHSLFSFYWWGPYIIQMKMVMRPLITDYTRS